MWSVTYADEKGEEKRVPCLTVASRVASGAILLLICIAGVLLTVQQPPLATDGSTVVAGKVSRPKDAQEVSQAVVTKTGNRQQQQQQKPEKAKVKSSGVEKRKLRDLAALRDPRQSLASWVSTGAAYEEVRLLTWFKRWLAKTPRTMVNMKLDGLIPVDEWQDCSFERRNCTCASGKVRFGDQEKDVWVYAKQKRKGELIFECSKAFQKRAPPFGQICTQPDQ